MIDRVVVAGGGTGGHLFPGLAVVEELRRRLPSVKVVFVGTARGIEARMLPRLGEELELLDVTPLKGRAPAEAVRSLLRLPSSVVEAARIVRRHRADLVLGVGGYASGPMLLAAGALGVPTAVLEQNARLGLTNRLLAPIVGRAYVTFPQTARHFRPAAARVVGNPVRRAFVEAARRAAADPDGFEARSRRILVLGGSQGARALNGVAPDAIAEALGGDRAATVVHQTGEAMAGEVQARYAALGVKAQVVPFIDDVARAYGSAAVVIARAGATTIAELCALGRPAILVPYPHAADDHQAKNAEALASVGAAVALREADLDVPRLAAELRALLSDGARRRRMAAAARAAGRPEAAAAIVDDLFAWLGCPVRSTAADDPGRATDGADDPLPSPSEPRSGSRARGGGSTAPRRAYAPRGSVGFSPRWPNHHQRTSTRVPPRLIVESWERAE